MLQRSSVRAGIENLEGWAVLDSKVGVYEAREFAISDQDSPRISGINLQRQISRIWACTLMEAFTAISAPMPTKLPLQLPVLDEVK